MRTLIAGGFLGVQQTIQVVAEFLGEHRNALLQAGLLQPIRVEVDRARGEAIGTSRSGHGASGEQPNRGEAREFPRGPLANQVCEARLFSVKVESFLGRSTKRAIGSPLSESQLPLLVQG